jgi:hypothetical protein
MKALLVATLLALTCAPAGAVCPSHNPLDLRCVPADFINPTFGSVGFFAQNPSMREAEIMACTAPGVWRRPPPSWCAAAFQAQRIASGAQMGWTR